LQKKIVMFILDLKTKVKNNKWEYLFKIESQKKGNNNLGSLKSPKLIIDK